jgi:GxxExxY protein
LSQAHKKRQDFTQSRQAAKLAKKRDNRSQRDRELAKQIVDAAYRVQTTLGQGLLESVYEEVLAYELEPRGLRTTRQQPVPLVCHGVHIEVGFRADLIVEDLVIVEIKSVEVVALVHKKQFLTHLRLPDQGRHHARC